jgi:heterodisulfide reductase subunit B2
VTDGPKRYSYFPGCTLATTAVDYDASGRAVAAALGLELREVPDWNCCGASFPLSAENVMGFVAPARVLIAAQDAKNDLATLCAVCFNVLKRSDAFLRKHSEAADRLNAFVTEGDYNRSVNVRHLLGVLRDDVGWEAVRQRVVAPLHGLRAAPYYGCLLLRPASEMELDDPETPSVLHDLLRALGADVVSFPHQTECCGSTLLVSAPAANQRLSAAVIDSARAAGATLVATACPLCKFNLDRAQEGRPRGEQLPVAYFTQAMAAAFGIPEQAGPAFTREVAG